MIYDKATLDNLYNLGAEPWGHLNTRKEIRLHYNRAVMMPYIARRVSILIPYLNQLDNILVIGCGYGWLVELLQAAGYTNTAGTDISEYLLGRINGNETLDIREAQSLAGASDGDGNRVLDQFGAKISNAASFVISEDSATRKSRDKVKAFFGVWPDVIVTEDVTSLLTNAEKILIENNLKDYAAARFYHLNGETVSEVV